MRGKAFRIILSILVWQLAGSASALELCIDADGDGYGWNGVESCDPEGEGDVQPIAGACLDLDGDGYGWNGVESCDPKGDVRSIAGACLDSDGDGYGWNGVESCDPEGDVRPVAGACLDSDGDGYGWNGVESCDPEGDVRPVAGACLDSDGDGYGWNGVESCDPEGDVSTLVQLVDLQSSNQLVNLGAVSSAVRIQDSAGSSDPRSVDINFSTIDTNLIGDSNGDSILDFHKLRLLKKVEVEGRKYWLPVGNLKSASLNHDQATLDVTFSSGVESDHSGEYVTVLDPTDNSQIRLVGSSISKRKSEHFSHLQSRKVAYPYCTNNPEKVSFDNITYDVIYSHSYKCQLNEELSIDLDVDFTALEIPVEEYAKQILDAVTHWNTYFNASNFVSVDDTRFIITGRYTNFDGNAGFIIPSENTRRERCAVAQLTLARLDWLYK